VASLRATFLKRLGPLALSFVLFFISIVQAWAIAGDCLVKIGEPAHGPQAKGTQLGELPFAKGKRSAVGLLLRLKNGQLAFVCGSPATDGHISLYNFVNSNLPVDAILWHGEFESENGVITHANETAGISQDSGYPKDNPSIENLKKAMKEQPELFQAKLGLRAIEENAATAPTQWIRYHPENMHLSWQQAVLSNSRHDNQLWKTVFEASLDPKIQGKTEELYGKKFIDQDGPGHHDTFAVEEDLMGYYKKYLAFCDHAAPKHENRDIHAQTFQLTDYIQGNLKVTKEILKHLIQYRQYPSRTQYALLMEMLDHFQALGETLQKESGSERYNFDGRVILLPKPGP